MLAKVIDISIDSFKKYPPKDLTSAQIDQIKNTYLGYKHDILYPHPQYENLKSLRYSINDIFIYFQESSGSDVEYFWQQIIKNELPYKRENKLLKILKRQKIKNDIEYNYLIDVLVPYIQQGIINIHEEVILKKLIVEFETKKTLN
jgi:hypothetical protein